MNRIAVIIPCFNAAHLVGNQLAALAAQRPRRDVDVVLVDDGSNDDLDHTIRRHQADLAGEVKLVRHSTRRGTGAARNTGVRAAKDADRLLFLDADDLIADDYLEAMAAALEVHELVTAQIDYKRLNSPQVLRSTPADQLCDILTPSLFKPHVLGGLMGLSRQLFDHIGGFDDQLPALADLDISWRAQLAGRTIGVANTTVSVGIRGTHRGRWRRSRFQGRDIVALRTKFADHGVEPITYAEHLRGWLQLVAQVARVGAPAGRSALVWEIGWQVGVLGALLSGHAGSAPRLPVEGAK